MAVRKRKRGTMFRAFYGICRNGRNRYLGAFVLRDGRAVGTTGITRSIVAETAQAGGIPLPYRHRRPVPSEGERFIRKLHYLIPGGFTWITNVMIADPSRKSRRYREAKYERPARPRTPKRP